MEPLKYDYSWDDLSPSEGIVIQKCTVFGADLAYRSPQFADWIHIEGKGISGITVLNGYDPNWKHDPSLFEYEFEDIEQRFEELFGWGFLELLKEYDGVFIDMEAVYERWNDWDGEGEFDVSDLVKPYTYY